MIPQDGCFSLVLEPHSQLLAIRHRTLLPFSFTDFRGSAQRLTYVYVDAKHRSLSWALGLDLSHLASTLGLEKLGMLVVLV